MLNGRNVCVNRLAFLDIIFAVDGNFRFLLLFFQIVDHHKFCNIRSTFRIIIFLDSWNIVLLEIRSYSQIENVETWSGVGIERANLPEYSRPFLVRIEIFDRRFYIAFSASSVLIFLFYSSLWYPYGCYNVERLCSFFLIVLGSSRNLFISSRL